jgi:DNA-binding MarR family transcriptional regulator
MAEAQNGKTPEPNLGVLLFVAYRAMENRVFETLASAGFDDVTPAQARVFQRIGPHGTRLTDLAEQAQVTKQTAGVLVDALERAGYVYRVPDPHDARARLICISERGEAVVAAAAEVVAAVESEWSDYLGPTGWSQLRRSLLRLRTITDPYA